MLNAGDRVDRYCVEAVLGQGGMATVYRATHAQTGKTVALKVIQGHLLREPSLRARFLQEARICSVIGESPHIVDVLDAGFDERLDLPFLVMPLLSGQTLQERLSQRGPLPHALAASLFAQLGAAIDQAHAAGVVHRDLKPGNLFLSADREGKPRLMVLDFGIAKLLSVESHKTATEVGSPAYMAPEQLSPMFRELARQRGLSLADQPGPATDVWALGLLCYEALTGALPGQFWGVASPQDLPLRILDQPPLASARAGDRAPLLPPGFDAWMARCLEREAHRRFLRFGEATSALVALLEGRPSASTSAAASPATSAAALAASVVSPPAAVIAATPAAMASAASAAVSSQPGASPAQPSGAAPARRRAWPLALGAALLVGAAALAASGAFDAEPPARAASAKGTAGAGTAGAGAAGAGAGAAGAGAAVQITELELPAAGPQVRRGSRVSVHFHTTLADGAEVECSYADSDPRRFTVGAGAVVKGWEQGMIGMRAGGKRRIVVPPGLAHGAAGLPGRVPPNAALIIDVDLISIDGHDPAISP